MTAQQERRALWHSAVSAAVERTQREIDRKLQNAADGKVTNARRRERLAALGIAKSYKGPVDL